MTARRVSENLEKVPLSITILSPSDIEQNHIRDDSDLASSVPGLLVQPENNQLNFDFTLRGQTTDPNTGSSPAVQTYINDVVANPLVANMFYDMSSIQVLKGPQGTLFGRNTTGGALLYETKKPDPDLGGFLSLSGGNYSLFEATGALNVPVVRDKVLVRLAGQHASSGGYQYNYFTGGELGGYNRSSGRLSVEIAPSADFKSTTVAEYSTLHGTPLASALYSVYLPGQINHGVALTALTALIYNPQAPFFGAYGSGGAGENIWQRYLAYQHITEPGAVAGGILGALASQQQHGNLWVDTQDPSYIKSHNWQIDNTSAYTVNSDLTIKNIFGANEARYQALPSVEGTPFQIYRLTGQGQTARNTGLSEELQLLGNVLDGRLDYVTGIYLSRSRQVVYATSGFFDTQPFTLLEPGGVPIPNDSAFTLGSKSAAAYAQGNYDLSHGSGNRGLKLTGGFRYTVERDTLSGAPTSNLLTKQLGQPGEAHTFSNPSWTVGLNWQVDPSLMLYLAQRGSWRSGGFSPFASRLNSGVAAQGGNRFPPETTRDVEIGLKYRGRDLGVPAQLNVALYQQWTHNLQRLENITANGMIAAFTTTASAPAAQARGVELDANIRPVPSLELGISGAYTDAFFSNGHTLILGTAYDFGPSANVPKWSGSIYAQVHVPVPATWGAMSVRAQVFGQTSFYFTALGATAIPETRIPGYSLINLHADWEGIFGSRFTLSAFARNAADRRYYTNGSAYGQSGGFNTANPGEPRRFGVLGTYKF